ncbi:hypothetical protein C0J52_08174, partial [Blattella germanica]
RKKRKHKKEKIDEINENLEKGNTHIAYKEIKIIKEGFKARTHLCKGTDGILIGDKEQIKNRWSEYFENLLNSNGKSKGNIESITMENSRIDRVDKFKYLGVILTDRNDEIAEIQNRIRNANKAYYAILPLIKDRDINRKSRLTLYKTSIPSILVYGSENWIITKKVESIMEEERIPRKVLDGHFGGKRMVGRPRIQ